MPVDMKECVLLSNLTEGRKAMLEKGLSASMMCVDFLDTKKDLEQLKEAKIEYLHFDIMDGEFVSNYAVGPCMIEGLREGTDIKMDIHLMVGHPERKIEYFNLQAGDAVSVHAETTAHLHRVVHGLKKRGVTVGAALNPATKIDVLEHVLDELDFVLIMTVNPGFARQKLVPVTLEKIASVRQYLDQHGYSNIIIQVDGNVNVENAVKMKAAGADNFVCGTAGLFRKDMDIVTAAKVLREALNGLS